MISHFLCAFILLDHFLWLSLQEQRGCLFSNKEQKYTELEEEILLEQEENADVISPLNFNGNMKLKYRGSVGTLVLHARPCHPSPKQTPTFLLHTLLCTESSPLWCCDQSSSDTFSQRKIIFLAFLLFFSNRLLVLLSRLRGKQDSSHSTSHTCLASRKQTRHILLG